MSTKQYFLNHLCDEELQGVEHFVRQVFLNHLCDEEQPQAVTNSQN
ncbi:hypothetical protein [Acinetobacter baumannii]